MEALGGLAGRASPLTIEARSASQLAGADRDIRAGSAKSADISLSDRQRPEGFHRILTSAVRSPDRLSSTPDLVETDDNTTPYTYRTIHGVQRRVVTSLASV